MRPCALVLVLLFGTGAARAQNVTPLLQDDLQSNRRTKIDAGDDLDASLEAIMGGGGGFSTRKLEAIEDRLRADLKRERPRATPRLIVFLYPGRVNARKLRAMAEIFVDMELVIDPCERAVCREAVARHIELVGRAVGQPVIATPDYRIVFQRLTLVTSTRLHDQEVHSYLVPMGECIAASRRAGGGLAWLEARERADSDYEPLMVKAITRNAQARRLALVGLPAVHRAAGEVAVALHVRGDRVRGEQQVVDALWAEASALKSNPATPPSSQLEVALDVPMRGTATRKYRASGAPVGLYVDGRIDRATLFSNYVEQVREGKDAGQRLTFDDAEASGREAAGDDGAGAPDDNAALAVIASHFGALGACARDEVARNARFRGVTVGFKWLPSGRAAEVAPREPALRGGALARCLEQALGALSLPRFSGGPRSIDYPIRIQ